MPGASYEVFWDVSPEKSQVFDQSNNTFNINILGETDVRLEQVESQKKQLRAEHYGGLDISHAIISAEFLSGMIKSPTVQAKVQEIASILKGASEKTWHGPTPEGYSQLTLALNIMENLQRSGDDPAIPLLSQALHSNLRDIDLSYKNALDVKQKQNAESKHFGSKP